MVPSPTGGRQVPQTNTTLPMGIGSVSLVLLTAMLWGGTSVAAKFSMETLPPIAVACVRFGMAALCMLIWCLLTRVPLVLRGQEMVLVSLAGLLMAVQILMFNLGVHFSNASHGTVLIQTFIFPVLVIEHFITRTDRLTARKLLGSAIAALSVAAALTTADPGEDTSSHHPDQPRLLGDFLLLISAGLLSAKIVFVKFAVQRMDSAKLIFWHDVVGVGCFFICSLALEGIAPWSTKNFTWPTILGLMYQGILVAGFCFAAHAWLLRYHSATQLSVFSFATPLFGLMLAMVLRSDPMSPWIVIAGVGVAVGIFLVNRRSTEIVAGE